jgi:hypothetical protein
MEALGSLAPHSIYAREDCPATQWNGKRQFSEDADAIVASVE